MLSAMSGEPNKKTSIVDHQQYRNVQYWISDLKNLDAHPSFAKTVCIMGVVVSVIAPGEFEHSKRPIGYQLDDGTGVIKVVHFLQKRIRAQQESSCVERLQRLRGQRVPLDDSDLLDGLATLAERTEGLLAMSRAEFAVGSCVEAKGRLQHFRGQAELLAFSVRKVEDPAAEVERMLRMEDLKEHVYPAAYFKQKK